MTKFNENGNEIEAIEMESRYQFKRKLRFTFHPLYYSHSPMRPTLTALIESSENSRSIYSIGKSGQQNKQRDKKHSSVELS